MTVLEWYRQGWRIFKENPVKLIIVSILCAIIALLVNFTQNSLIESLVYGESIFFLLLALFIGWGILISTAIGISIFLVQMVRGEQPTFASVLDGFRFFVSGIIGAVIVLVIVSLGTILLIIPGIILSIALSMWVFAIGDKRQGVLAAIKYSFIITRGRRMRIFLASLLGTLLVFIGSIPLGLGLLIVIPWLWATFAVAYEDLNSAYIAKLSQSQSPSSETTYEITE